jgi:hypothetical protein
MFGDDAFQFLLSAGFEQAMAVTIKLIAKLNTTLVIGSNQMLQAASTLYECLLAKVLAIEWSTSNAYKMML